VLVVDPSAESRDVFQTALSHRGWKILATSALDEALAVASGAMPSVVVIDGDVLENDATAAVRCQQLFRPTQSKTSLIILGRLSGDSLPVKAARIDKPYHYGPLIRRIEALCRSSSSRSDAGEESRD
jgi:DNA-binding response OmpR family regulator